MIKKYFGTDGIRGKVNDSRINGEMFFRFGLAAGTYFKNLKKTKQIAIIAKDTRLSGYTLEPALVSGLASTGMHVILLGPLPTNGLAMLTKKMTANLGIMITASHNLYHDNGLKLFGPDGLKLSDKIEKKIEKLIDLKISKNLSDHKLLGRVKRIEDANLNYINILRKNFPKNFSLKGLKIAIDCANGAGYKSTPLLLKSLGARVISSGISPNGHNINKNCGSTYPNNIKNLVKRFKADIGISLDGDADRIIVVDEKLNIVDGDQIIATIANNWKKKRILKSSVIGTQMSNYGLEKYFKKLGIKFYRAKVGDRYVKEMMRKHNSNLGGEQSGHIILGNFATTGDGLLVALEILFSMSNGLKASNLLSGFKPTPQVLQNVIVPDKSIIKKKKCIKAIKVASKLISNKGRLLVRASGTESKIRIMAESDDKKIIYKCINIVKRSILN